MADAVRQGMDEGAWGLSTGLWYSPMSYADRAENVALCRAAGERGGLMAIHMRDYGDGILDAIDESAEIAAAAGLPLQISHLQIGGARNWGRAGEVLARIDRLRSARQDVTFDAYPYTAGSTLVQAMLPVWATEGGPEAISRRLREAESRADIVAAMNAADRDWTRHMLCGAKSTRFGPLEGRSFAEIAEREGQSIGETICAVLEEEALQACFIAHLGVEEDLRAILAHPAQMIGSDGLHLRGKTHPRLYGTFPRLLARYVREEKLLSLEDAVRRMSGFPAERMGFRDRGVLKPGLAADVVLFDPETVADLATYEDPCRPPAGIRHVLVNGRFAVRDGSPTGERAGQVLTPD